jgi:hypothetical protein
MYLILSPANNLGFLNFLPHLLLYSNLHFLKKKKKLNFKWRKEERKKERKREREREKSF